MASPPHYYDTRVDTNIPIPMRDGTVLRADIYRPDAGGRWPVLLMRFVMDPNDEVEELGACFAQRGYAFVYFLLWEQHWETVFPNGIYRLEEHRGWALWMALNCLENQVAPEHQAQVRARLQAAQEDHDSWIWHLPVTEYPPLEGASPWHFEHLQHGTDLEWWARTDARTKFDAIDVPMLRARFQIRCRKRLDGAGNCIPIRD